MSTPVSDGYEVSLLDQERVEIRREGRVVTMARWNGCGLVDCNPGLPEAPARAAEILALLSQRVDDEIVAAWKALPDPCDASGVDLTLIDWMLAMSPAERLANLEEAARTFDSLEGHGDPLR